MSLANTLLPQIKAILSSSDLDTVSAKAVRKELVRRGADEAAVKEARKEIDERISEIYDQLSSSRNSTSYSAPSGPSGPSEPSQPIIAPSSQPIPLADIKPKLEPTQRVKVEPRAPEPVEPETDAQMAARLQAEFDSLGSGRASRAAAAPKAKKRKAVVKRKSRAEVSGDEDGEEVVKKKRRGGGGGTFNKDMILSDTLAALVGEPRLSRPQTVKRIWDYVKERDLQDPADKRYILCDDKLRSVFHSDKIHMFTMNKILAAHFMNPDEIIKSDAGDEKPRPQEARMEAKEERTGVDAMPASGGYASRSGMVDMVDVDSDDDDDGFY